MNLTVAFWLVPLIAIPAVLLGTQAWPRLNRLWQVGLIVLMLALIGVFGLRLAQVIATNITQLPEWDFSFFWLNGQVAARGLNFYDPVQYQRIAQQLLPPNPTLEYQQAVLEVGFWYPPPSMFLFLPLGWMNARTAAVAWFAFHLLVLLLDGVWVWHIFLRPQKKLGLLLAFVLILMMGATQLTFNYAQTNALLLLFVLLFYKDRGRGRAGVWLALAIVVKPIALVLGLVVVVHRRWRVLGVTVGVLALISLAALVVFGPRSFQSFITSSPTTRQPLWVYSEAVNQSLLALILRQTTIGSLAKSPLTNPAFIGLAGLLLVASAWLILRLGREQDHWAIAIALTLGLIIYPATLNHYSLLLILPLLVLWQARAGLRQYYIGLLAFFIAIIYFWMSYRDGTWAIVANTLTWLGVCILATQMQLKLETRRIRQHKHTLALLGLLVLATALRFYKLDAQSLWYDEGNSARIAERSVSLIIAGAAGDIHPPLYYLILKFWRSAFGSSEFGLRSLSAVCGVLLVLFTFLIGRTWCTVRAGLIAAFLVCISPFGIYYSQETRMYALLAVWAAVSTWALMRLARVERLERLEIREWRLRSELVEGVGIGLCYVLATAAGLYTQYAYPFVMVAQGVCVLLWLGSQIYVRRTGDQIAEVRCALQHLGVYALLNIIAILFYAPWLPIALRQIRGWVVAPQEYQLGPAVLDALRWLTVGRTLPLSEATLPMLAFGVCATLGLLLTRRNEDAKKEASSFLSSSLRFFVLFILALLPLALLFAFKLYRDAYLKFLLVCLAPLCLWVAFGVDALTEKLKGRKRLQGMLVALCLGVFTGLLWPSLNNLYNNPAYARDDYRAIAKLLREGERADDAVLFIAPNQWEVSTYYYPDTQKTFPLTYKPASEADANAELMKITVLRKRLFVLYYAEKEADPNGWYERWLATHAFKAEERWFGNIRLAVYAPPNFMAGIAPRNVVFGAANDAGGAIELVNNQLFDFKVRVGDVVPIGLIWQANTKVNPNYKVFVHIGKPDAPPIAQNDSEPAAGFRPTHSWPVGEHVSDRRAVWIHPGTPRGQYAIFVGLYDANTGVRLKLQDGSDRLKMGEIVVVDE